MIYQNLLKHKLYSHSCNHIFTKPNKHLARVNNHLEYHIYFYQTLK